MKSGVSKGWLLGRLSVWGYFLAFARISQRDKEDEDIGVIPEGYSNLCEHHVFCVNMYICILYGVALGSVLFRTRDWTLMIHVGVFQFRIFYDSMIS